MSCNYWWMCHWNLSMWHHLDPAEYKIMKIVIGRQRIEMIFLGLIRWIHEKFKTLLCVLVFIIKIPWVIRLASLNVWGLVMSVPYRIHTIILHRMQNFNLKINLQKVNYMLCIFLGAFSFYSPLSPSIVLETYRQWWCLGTPQPIHMRALIFPLQCCKYWVRLSG